MRDSAIARWSSIVAATVLAWSPVAQAAETDLSDQPARTTLSVPANVLLALSVEWPTGNVQAYNDETSGTGCPGRDGGRSACYFSPGVRASRVAAANVGNPSFKPQPSMPYLGYFDPYKCYRYNSTGEYFEPYRYTDGYDSSRGYKDQPGTSTATCGSAEGWSGNFLNWATMQTTDLFRWVMTGGDRAIDTTALTVLEKARHDGQGGTAQFPIKQLGKAFSGLPITAPRNVTPYTWNELYVSVEGRNTSMRIASNSGISSNTQDFKVRVKVCDPNFPETATTCTAYPAGTLKPTGLIQANAMDVRFAAMGYLLDDDILRDGGVLRARMKFVGPTRPVLGAAGETANAHAEWDASTGIYILNPDSADAAATPGTITQSGVTQYLNRFGRRDGYKNYDPVSEMYYEALRYYMNLGPTPEYSSGLTGSGAARKIDGFPVITNWDDPLAPPPGFEDADEWCPNNFIIGIADANTHKDKRLPGNTSTVNEGGAQPSNAASFPANVATLLNEIISTELANEGVQLLKSNGTPLAPGPVNCCDGSAYLASLAYYANSRDIRPDSENTIQARGRQRVRSYFVDVRESGSWGTGVSRTDPRRRNQLWLAAKYGGYIDQNTVDPPGGPYPVATLDIGDAIADENSDGVIDIRDVWDRDGDWLPDNYYEAGSPEALVDGLKAAFSSIRAQIATAVGINTSTRSVELQTDTGIFRVNYDPAFWSGNVIGYTYSGFDEASGNITAVQKWNAAEKLDSQGWDNGRRIVTWTKNSPTAATGTAKPFRWNQLSGWQQTALNNDPQVLEWLRGRNDIGAFRKRLRKTATGTFVETKLGDIIDSEARYVGAPNAPLSDAYNPGYGAFKAAWKDRREMLYVGANDGMLHALDASVSGTEGGSEVFAYVPSFLYSRAAGAGTGVLADLPSKNYVHRNYVNATAWIFDADFARTNGATDSSGDWRTILIGGLGKGGRGYFAIDVTDPAAFDTEAGAAGKVLWEFQDSTMGYSYGAPQVVKTKKWGWVALLTSGYNNIASHGSNGGGQGWLYVVDVKTGALLQKISTGAGSDDSPSGLAQVTAYTPDSADGTITEVYGGDLDGNVWRFDFTSPTANVPAPVLFAKLPANQSVTSGPVVRVAPITRNRYVFVGTGRLLGQDDIYTTHQQSFYAFRDGSRLARWESGEGGAPSFPVTRSVMVANTDLLNPITPDPEKPAGWYHDLLASGERVVIDPQDTDLGKISWLGTIPQTTQLCNEGGSSRIYAANFETGQSQLYDPSTLTGGTPTRITSFDPKTGAVGLRLVRVGGNIRAVITGQFNELKLTQGYLRYLDPRSMGWREITEPGS